jgi:hypothetical protein
MKLEDEQLIRQYLLGELDEQQLQQVEERTMTDDDFYRQVELIEDELVEEYVSSGLTEQQRARFEQVYLANPKGRQQVSFTTAFNTHLARSVDVQPSPMPIVQPSPMPAGDREFVAKDSWRSAFANFWQAQKPLAVFSLATMALLLGLSVWLVITVRGVQSQLAELQAQHAAAQAQAAKLQQQLDEAQARANGLQDEVQSISQVNGQLLEQLDDKKKTEKKTGEPELAGDSVFVLVLSPGETRSGASEQEALLTADKQTLQLRLTVREDTFKSFRAKIMRLDDSTSSLTLSSIAVRKGKSETLVILQIPATIFPDGAYRIELSGTTAEGKTEPVERYAFRIRRSS